MRKFVLFAVLYAVCLGGVNSCSKSDASPEPVKVDAADYFVGEYSGSCVAHIQWGNAKYNDVYEVRIKLSKISPNEILMEGPWTSRGIVSGKTVSFIDDLQVGSNPPGSVTYMFGLATKDGATIKFTYCGSGSVQYTDGKLYNYFVDGNVVIVKSD